MAVRTIGVAHTSPGPRWGPAFKVIRKVADEQNMRPPKELQPLLLVKPSKRQADKRLGAAQRTGKGKRGRRPRRQVVPQKRDVSYHDCQALLQARCRPLPRWTANKFPSVPR